MSVKNMLERIFTRVFNFIRSLFKVKFDSDDGKENYALSLILKLIIFGSIAVIIFPMCGFKWSALGCFKIAMGGLLVCGAALVIGGFSGFLFGIPRTVQGTAPAKPAPAAGADTANDDNGNGEEYKSNTNLEQISDWLTKIIVGLGLTQIGKIPGELNALGTQLKPVFGGGDMGWAMAIASVLYFLICGFLFGYLWTRIYFVGILDRAQRELLKQLKKKEMEDAATKENNRLRGEIVANEVMSDEQHKHTVEPETDGVITAAENIRNTTYAEATPDGEGSSESVEGSIPSGGTFTQLSRNIADYTGPQDKALKTIGPITQKDDPQKGRFGGLDKYNGLVLNATVTNHATISGLFNVKIWVAPDNSTRIIDGKVIFYLHDTFSNPVEIVTPVNNRAEINLVAYGAFTVGAVTDGGATMLEKDLAQLPDAPALFKSR